MYLKTIVFASAILLTVVSCKEKEETVDKTVKEQKVTLDAEKEAVAAVMKSYKDAIQNLTTEGTKELFTEEATVFESGGSEGTYTNYLSHHLGPELGHFNSFIFSDYTIDVEVDLPYAFTTETYIYTIDLKADKERGTEARIIKKKGVATSDLKKIDGKWKIIKTHSSSRNIRK
ncbi:MAG TPA: nuclear transport factor 2 family protein [Flavobacteriia bacterium]|jgi:ketosteroid isomerase-like protein|nr:nuclear transport factor 2 family protein [Flavobacteriia bacterium]